MTTQMKGGASRLRTEEIGRWKHHNVYTSVHAELALERVTWFFVEQVRTYSTIATAGEAQTYESGDLTAAIDGLTLAQKCIRSASRWCQRCTSWPYGFRPNDLVVVDPDEDNTHPNLVDCQPDGWMRTLIFENRTPCGLLVYKILQFRIAPWGLQFGKTRLLELEHLADAISGLARARRLLQHKERELWFDRSRELLK